MDQIILLKKEHGNIEASVQFFLRHQVSKKAKILDIGCRYGSLAYNLYRRGYQDVYGLDVNQKAIARGRQSYREIAPNLVWYNGQQIPCGDQSVDVVLMFDVIEHIPAVKKYLRDEVHRILKTGGLLLFQTPNKYLNIPWEIFTQKSLTRWKRYHCSLQTKGTLKNLLLEAGFRDVNIGKFTILTDHNKNKAKKKLGLPGIILLHILSKAPLPVYPNFWGSARK